MIVAAILITLLYCFLIVSFSFGFELVKPFKSKQNKAKNSFSVIIPFRNEAQVLPHLLESITQLNFPENNYEIIFVDDGSEDNSVEIIENLINQPFDSAQGDIKIIPNTRKTSSPKKDAINSAIEQAKFDWIVTTDADCKLPRNWLLTFDAFIEEKNPQLIVGPVTYQSKQTFLEQFQLLDFLSLMGSTIGGFGIKKPFMCNGANLCYKKQTFSEINGFEGNSTIASGDDIFLLEKMVKKYPEDVHYLKSKEAIIITKPQQTFKQLINQRVRWAAKATAYENSFSKLVSLSVLSMNILVLILLISSIFNYISWKFFAFTFIFKFCIDLLLILKASLFFKQQNVLRHYLLSSILYPVFIMFVGIASLKSGYYWKGRTFKK